jgi:hypothetical protein
MQLGGLPRMGEVTTPGASTLPQPVKDSPQTAPPPPKDDETAPAGFAEKLKKYAPYIVGGIIIYYLISKK